MKKEIRKKLKWKQKFKKNTVLLKKLAKYGIKIKNIKQISLCLNN